MTHATQAHGDTEGGPFFQESVQLVHKHGAINNTYLDRFEKGDFTKDEFQRFAVEFYQFSRNFPVILCQLLVNTADETEQAELTKILTSELGDGDPRARHELLYRDFLRSIGIEPRDIISAPMKDSTKAYIDGMFELYGGRDHDAGVGASFGLENMAITMWDHLLPGIFIAKEKWFSELDPTYFTFHRALEETHEEAMEAATIAYEKDVSRRKSFSTGCKEVLDYLEGFWLGLEADKTTPFKLAKARAA